MHFGVHAQMHNFKPLCTNGFFLLWLDTADQSHHCPLIPMQALKVQLGQWPSFTGMDYGALHTCTHGHGSLDGELVVTP